VFSKVFGARKPIIGLDIGAGTIKLVQLDLAARIPVLTAMGVIAAPSDAMQGNIVKDPSRLARQIRELVSSTRVKCRHVALAVPASSVFVKAMRVAAVPLEDLRAQVYLEAAQSIPYDMSSIALDFHVVDKSPDGLLEVLVVAIKREVLSGYLEAVEQAGLVASVVDVDSFSLQNCFEYNEASQRASTTALIDVGARFSAVNIVGQGRSLCLGDIPVGVHTALRLISDILGVTSQEAEAILSDPSALLNEKSSAARQQALAVLASDIHKHLSLLSSSGEEDISVKNARLSGGGATLHGLQEHLRVSLGCSVDIMRPFAQVSVPVSFASDYFRSMYPLMGVALGLSLRCPGDEIVSALAV
jgi:type IV pilus assembly protein PilM